MTLQDLVSTQDFTVACGREHLGREVTGGYSGDLLSDVMANSRAGNVWITMQTHLNIVAVAVLKDLAAVILVNGREAPEETIRKAAAEQMPILVSRLPAFDAACALHRIGVGR